MKKLLLLLLLALAARADVMDRLVVKTNATFQTAITYALPDEPNLNLTVDYGMALDVGLTSTTVHARARTVSTIANLISLVDPTTSDIFSYINVLGYANAGDGGGGNFRKTFAAGGVTNTGTFFVSTVNPTYAWERIIVDGVITPQLFGAQANGTNLTHTAIQAAIDYMTNRPTGGEVFLPPGKYMTGDTIRMRPRVILRGPGNTRSEQYQTTGSSTGFGSGGSAVIYPDPSISTAFETILFDGTTSTELPTKGSGTTFLNGEDGEMFPFYGGLEDLCIYGTLSSGGGRKSAVRVWRAMYVRIKGCTVMMARGNVLYAYGCLGLRLQDNTFINYHGRNSFIFALSDGFLLNNQFEAGLGYNLWAQMNHNAVVGNSFPNPGEDLYVGSVTGSATNAFTSFTASASTDLITATLNGSPLTTPTIGDPVFFHANSGTLPGGLSENVAYFVSSADATAGTFSVSSRITSTSGGTGGAWQGNKLDITSTGSGDWSVSQAAESNFLLYNCNGGSVTGGRVDFSLRDGIRVIGCSYPNITGVEYYNIGRMQGLLSIATRTNTIAALHLMTTTSEGQFLGSINMSATNGVGRIGVWLDGTGLYRNTARHTYNNCATNVWNTSDVTANTVDYLDQGGGTMLWKAPATVSGAWTFNNPALFQNATAGLNSATFKSEESTSVVDLYGAGTTSGLGPRMNFYRSRGTIASPTQTQSGDTVIPLIAQALDNASTYRTVGEIQVNAENNVTSSAFGGSVVLRAVPIGAATTRQNFFYGLSRGVAISDSTAGYPDNTTVLDLVSTTRGLGMPSMTADVTSARDGTLWYRSDTDVLKLRANSVTVDVAAKPATETLAYSSTNVTLTATSGALFLSTLTLTNNCLLTITAADGASGGITFKPDASTSYTVYLASAIKLLGGSTSFVVTNSSTETVNLEWKQTKRGSSDVVLANKAVYP